MSNSDEKTKIDINLGESSTGFYSILKQYKIPLLVICCIILFVVGSSIYSYFKISAEHKKILTDIEISRQTIEQLEKDIEHLEVYRTELIKEREILNTQIKELIKESETAKKTFEDKVSNIKLKSKDTQHNIDYLNLRY